MRILTLWVFLSAQGLQAQSPPEEQTAAVTNAQETIARFELYNACRTMRLFD